jgi:hypothetical protein
MERRTWALGALLLALETCCACSSASDAQANGASAPDAGSGEALRSFVGTVDDSDARVAVVTDGYRARLFFCGGDQSFMTGTKWFDGLDVSENATSLSVGGWHVQAMISKQGVSGEVRGTDAVSRTFGADAVDRKTLAGLYEGAGMCGRLGLIVTQASELDEPQAIGACVSEGHEPQQVNPILPLSDRGGVHVSSPADDEVVLMPAGL